MKETVKEAPFFGERRPFLLAKKLCSFEGEFERGKPKI